MTLNNIHTEIALQNQEIERLKLAQQRLLFKRLDRQGKLTAKAKEIFTRDIERRAAGIEGREVPDAPIERWTTHGSLRVIG
jgi:hypothetical protein